MTLNEFKWIWYMEFGHRMWGRAIGAFFLIPATFFWARGMLKPGMKPRILAFGTLIGLQVKKTYKPDKCEISRVNFKKYLRVY